MRAKEVRLLCVVCTPRSGEIRVYRDDGTEVVFTAEFRMKEWKWCGCAGGELCFYWFQ